MIWTAIRYIFTRPYMATLLVGTTIHVLTEITGKVFASRGHFATIHKELWVDPFHAIVILVIPYGVPYLVTRIGKHILLERQESSLMCYPQANPDLIMRLGRNGEVRFANHAALEAARNLGGEGSGPENLLPDNVSEITQEICGSERTLSAESQFVEHTYELNFRCFGDEESVFVSGRDVTQRLVLEKRLRESYNQLINVSNFADRTFRNFDPHAFELDHHYNAVMTELLGDEVTPEAHRPTHIYLTEMAAGGKLRGYVFCKRDGKLGRHDELIEIDPSSERAAIAVGDDDVAWSNWEDEENSLELYQDLFNPKVREVVGIIERFATYKSGDIAAIGFYRGDRVTELEAYVLKGVAVYAQSLKLISDGVHETEAAFVYTIEALARAAEANDEATGQHILRVNEYSKLLARKMELSPEFIHEIGYSTQMHDVGKIHLASDLLRKPGRLTEREFETMKEHTIHGPKILGDAARLAMACQIALGHHERYDGSGYPHGLRG